MFKWRWKVHEYSIQACKLVGTNGIRNIIILKETCGDVDKDVIEGWITHSILSYDTAEVLHSVYLSEVDAAYALFLPGFFS